MIAVIADLAAHLLIAGAMRALDAAVSISLMAAARVLQLITELQRSYS